MLRCGVVRAWLEHARQPERKREGAGAPGLGLGLGLGSGLGLGLGAGAQRQADGQRREPAGARVQHLK
eukprot:scaffold47557_cov36-Phaeocystis_antarctica.AAC.1